MSWRSGEVWLETDVLWFREREAAAAAAANAFVLPELPRFGPAETGLDASRRRRLAGAVRAAAEARDANRPRRRARRRFRDDAPDRRAAPSEQPTRGGAAARGSAEPDLPGPTTSSSSRPSTAAPVESAPQMPRVEWRHATSVGLQYAGRLVDGTQLPVEGPTG